MRAGAGQGEGPPTGTGPLPLARCKRVVKRAKD